MHRATWTSSTAMIAIVWASTACDAVTGLDAYGTSPSASGAPSGGGQAAGAPPVMGNGGAGAVSGSGGAMGGAGAGGDGAGGGSPPVDFAIDYFYDGNGIQMGTAIVTPGGEYVIFDQPGGCGPNDYAVCRTNAQSQVWAHNRDSCDPIGIDGPVVSVDCSEAVYNNSFVVQCCIVP